MTTFRCRACGGAWSEGPTRDHDESALCRHCLLDYLPANRDHEVKAEAGEAATERARADYYQNLCNLQGELIQNYRSFLLANNPQFLKDCTPREWDLGRQVYLLQKDNEALRELSEEYRKTLEEYAARIN